MASYLSAKIDSHFAHRDDLLSAFDIIDLSLSQVVDQLKVLDYITDDSNFTTDMVQAIIKGAIAHVVALAPALGQLEQAVRDARAGKSNPLIAVGSISPAQAA